jgi:hypothetical protein
MVVAATKMFCSVPIYIKEIVTKRLIIAMLSCYISRVPVVGSGSVSLLNVMVTPFSRQI